MSELSINYFFFFFFCLAQVNLSFLSVFLVFKLSLATTTGVDASLCLSCDII